MALCQGPRTVPGDPLVGQARRQDSVTGGAEINFGGARDIYFV